MNRIVMFFALKIYCEKVNLSVTLHNSLDTQENQKPRKPPSPALDSGYRAAITSQAALIFNHTDMPTA